MAAISNSMDEKLLFVSNLMDEKLKPIIMTQKNEILPRLQNIGRCYTDMFRRYQLETAEVESLKQDMAIVKRVVQEHSERLMKIANS